MTSAAPLPAIDAQALQASATLAAQFLRSLANPDRLMLLCALLDGERCVGDLEAATGLRQPSLSQQLGVLREEGLVATRREGKYIHYRVASPAAMQVLALLQAHFCPPCDAGVPPPACAETVIETPSITTRRRSARKQAV